MENVHAKSIREEIKRLQSEYVKVCREQSEINEKKSSLNAEISSIEKHLAENDQKLDSVQLKEVVDKKRLPRIKGHRIADKGEWLSIFIPFENLSTLHEFVSSVRKRTGLKWIGISTLMDVLIDHFLDNADNINLMHHWENIHRRRLERAQVSCRILKERRLKVLKAKVDRQLDLLNGNNNSK